MTNMGPDQSQPVSTDPIEELQSVAETLQRLRPEVIAALGRAATSEQASESAVSRVSAASKIIVDALTEIAEGVRQPVTSPEIEAAAVEVPAADPPATASKPVPNPSQFARMHQPRPQQTPEETVPLSLSEERIHERLSSFMASIVQPSKVRMVQVALYVGEGHRLDPASFELLKFALRSYRGVRYEGSATYEMRPGAHRMIPLDYPKPARRVSRQEQPVVPETPATVTAPVEPVVEAPKHAAQAEEESAPQNQPEETPAIAEEVLEDAVEAEEDDDSEEELTPEEIAGIAARWMVRRVSFTTAELREHLLANEAVQPEDVVRQKMNGLYRRLKPQIEAYFLERGETVHWLDDRNHPELVEPITGVPAHPKVIRHVIGFIPKKPAAAIAPQPEVLPAPSLPAPEATAPLPVEQPQLPEPPAESAAEHEKNITDEQIDEVVGIVRDAGGRITTDSLLDILTDPEEGYGLNADEAQARINAAMAVSRLYRRGIGGKYRGVSTEPRSKGGKANGAPAEREMSMDSVEAEVDRYLVAVRTVMATLMPLHPTAGLPYNKLWNKNKDSLSQVMDFDEFKLFCRRLRDDGLVEIPGDVKLHTKTPRSQKRIGSKVIVPDAARKKWRSGKEATLRELRDNALNRLIK
jgi:hypothetical protein